MRPSSGRSRWRVRLGSSIWRSGWLAFSRKGVPRADRSKGGRPPFDHVLMFKVLILQTLSNLSDERTEFLLRDRLTWIRFLGLALAAAVPAPNTIWTFREALTKAGAIEPLFALFDQALREAGYLA